MVNFIHECVGCTDIGLPCMGHSCTQGRMELRCDWCDSHVDKLYVYDEDELCEDCLLGSLERKEATEEEDACYLVNEEWLIDTDALGEFERIDFWTI